MTTHEARIELMPLKRRFGLTRADVEDYARALVGHPSNITPAALGEAVTRALVFSKRPEIHEVLGLALVRRSAHVAVPTLTGRGVGEGDPVAEHECHRCGGEAEFRQPFLYCRPCNAVQQVGRGMEGERRYALTIGEAVDLEPARPLVEDAAPGVILTASRDRRPGHSTVTRTRRGGPITYGSWRAGARVKRTMQVQSVREERAGDRGAAVFRTCARVMGGGGVIATTPRTGWGGVGWG